MQLTITPAYGRDYKSKADVRHAWATNKDFIIETFMHPDCGRYINRTDALNGGIRHLTVRYAQKRKSMVVSAQ